MVDPWGSPMVGMGYQSRPDLLSSVLSGPAGGLIGMGWVGRRLGVTRLIGFDREARPELSAEGDYCARRGKRRK